MQGLKGQHVYVNGKLIEGTKFAFDGCHKFYIIEDERDEAEAIQMGYDLYCICKLEEYYNNSCSLRFINNWKLDKTYALQCEKAIFEIK